MKTGSVLNMNKKENMEFLAVFCLFWECKTRVHGWLAKPLLLGAFRKSVDAIWDLHICFTMVYTAEP